MAGKIGLIAAIGCGVAACVAGGKFLYDKYKNLEKKSDNATKQYELSCQIIASQNKYIEELEKKLKKTKAE